jgi:hypothetical protein
MKRMLSLLVLLVACGNAGPLLAQESTENELNLVRYLRAKGWYDVARARIEELLKRNDATLAAALPIELARVNIAEARQRDPEQRFALFTAARAQLQDFIAKNKGKTDAALASAELARLTSYHAQAILSKAMREDEPRTRHERARPAEKMFIEAGKDLEAAIKAIESALKNASNAELKAVLERELKQVRFDVAINIFDQARTYIDKSKDDTNEKRAITMGKAKAEFEKLVKDQSTQVGWLANAWLMKCGMETTTPGEINKYYDRIIASKDEKTAQPAIQPAVRLVRYFALQDLTLPRDDAETIGNNSIAGKNVKVKMTPIQRLHKVQNDAAAWLKAYPGHLKTYEGQGVLFELAYAHFNEALFEKDQKLAGPNYEKAVMYFDQLAKLDGDLAERARQMSMSIQFKTLNTKGDLKTFDQNLMKAMIERKSVIATSVKLEEHAAKMAKAKGDTAKLDELDAQKKKIDAERKQHLKGVIASLNMALALETSKTPVKGIDDARYYLSGAYLAFGDPYRAAIVAEALGRARTPKSPDGAATAIATYASLQSREPNNAVLGQRLHDMAQFVLSQPAWSGEPVTSLANYHLAMSYQRDNKAKEAIAHLEKIAPDFNDYIYIQGQLVFIAEAAREKVAGDKKEQQWYLDTAKRALARMPKFNPRNDSPSVITMYFYAKMELSKYMYSEAIEELNATQELKALKKCNDMKKYVLSLRGEFEQLPGNTISKENRDQLEFSMQIMLKYADLGIAETSFRSDRKERFDEVIKATKKVVDDALALAARTPKDDPVKLKDYRVTGDILGLALRAHVQKGGDGIEKGKAILNVLKRLTSPEGGKPGNVVAALLSDIAGQINRLKKEGDLKALAATKTNYTSFLDEIAKEYDKKGYDHNSTLTLAHAYISLEFPEKAASIFSKVKAPSTLDKKSVKPKIESDDELKARQAWEDEVARYWAVQIEYIRALRACKDKESLEKAEKAIETLMKHPNARYKIQAWMEKNFILEDTQRYRAAYVDWGKKFMTQPALANRQDKDVQKIYFTGYYYIVRTGYKMATLDPDIKDRQKFIDGAARMIINLEFSKSREGWQIAGPMFQELLMEKESERLKKAYDHLKQMQSRPPQK